jgi:hypothetical protein
MSDERTRDQLIGEALVHGLTWTNLTSAGPGYLEGNADRPLTNALEYLRLMGHADAESGDASAPGGHFARVQRWLLFTDEQGFVAVVGFDTVAEAIEHFDSAERRFAQWLELTEEHGDDA